MEINRIIDQMEEYAFENDVPIIEEEGLQIIIELLQENEVKSLLEIGTAIGYSAAQFVINTNTCVTTIERENDMYEKACEYVTNLQLEHKITLINDDALHFDNKTLSQFDCIYIDGAKSQYLKFLEKYIVNLKPGGFVIFDNLLFHGFVFSNSVQTKSKNLQQLVRKLETFLTEMKNSEIYNFKLLPKGDGIGILYRKENNEN